MEAECGGEREEKKGTERVRAIEREEKLLMFYYPADVEHHLWALHESLSLIYSGQPR